MAVYVRIACFIIIFGLNFMLDAYTPEESLKVLLEGNKRYASDQLLHPNRTMERRESLVAIQKPFAIIVGCSDSRVSPEIVFDQGIGDLFVVRVAGNVVGAIELDSIEFSAIYLNSSIILVLGHENCGAVSAVFKGNTKDIEVIAQKIEKGIGNLKPDSLEGAIKANVRAVVSQIKNSEAVARLVHDKKINVVGGYYRLSTGEVELI